MNDFKSVVASMAATSRRREEELRRLVKNPSRLAVARAVADEFWGDLNYLCNFQLAVDGNGKRHEITEVIQKLQDYFCATFKRLTGEDYVPEVVRDHRAVKEGRP